MSKIRSATIALYRQKGKIHSRAVGGRFNTLRWAMVWISQLVFYGACWLDWDQRQAVLFDIAHEKFYLFGLVLWPQDGLLLALLLIGSATALFFVTALAGRLFCGFACPQTVYTSLFVWIEGKVDSGGVRTSPSTARCSCCWLVLAAGRWRSAACCSSMCCATGARCCAKRTRASRTPTS